MVEINLDEWKSVNAVDKKAVLGKMLTFYGERDFVKPATSKKNPSKTYMATYHIIYAIDKATGQKIKVFGTDNLHKIFEAMKDKFPFDDAIIFVEGRGQYGHGYYRLKNTRTPFPKKNEQTTTTQTTTQTGTPQ